MTDEDLAKLRDWIAYDPSDGAQRVREAVAPTVQELAKLIRKAQLFAPQPDRWVLMMRPAVYSALLPMRRRKLQPYIRAAWKGHAQP